MSVTQAPATSPAMPFMYLDWRARGRPGFVRSADPLPAVESALKFSRGDPHKARESLSSVPPKPKARDAVVAALGVETTGFAAGQDSPYATSVSVDELWPGWSDELVADFARFADQHRLWPDQK